MISTKTISEEEYLAFERASDTKHEFIYQTIVPTAGANLEHNFIASNLSTIIWHFLKNSDSGVFQSDMRIINSINGSYFYPDVCVSEGKPKMISRDILSNPLLVIEMPQLQQKYSTKQINS